MVSNDAHHSKAWFPPKHDIALHQWQIYGQVYSLDYSVAASQGKVIREKIIQFAGNMLFSRFGRFRTFLGQKTLPPRTQSWHAVKPSHTSQHHMNLEEEVAPTLSVCSGTWHVREVAPCCSNMSRSVNGCGWAAMRCSPLHPVHMSNLQRVQCQECWLKSKCWRFKK